LRDKLPWFSLVALSRPEGCGIRHIPRARFALPASGRIERGRDLKHIDEAAADKVYGKDGCVTVNP
jgi:hypothetical protein